MSDNLNRILILDVHIIYLHRKCSVSATSIKHAPIETWEKFTVVLSCPLNEYGSMSEVTGWAEINMIFSQFRTMKLHIKISDRDDHPTSISRGREQLGMY